MSLSEVQDYQRQVKAHLDQVDAKVIEVKASMAMAKQNESKKRRSNQNEEEGGQKKRRMDEDFPSDNESLQQPVEETGQQEMETETTEATVHPTLETEATQEAARSLKRISDVAIWIQEGKAQHPAYLLEDWDDSTDDEMLWIEWASNGEKKRVHKQQIVEDGLQARSRLKPNYFSQEEAVASKAAASSRSVSHSHKKKTKKAPTSHSSVSEKQTAPTQKYKLGTKVADEFKEEGKDKLKLKLFYGEIVSFDAETKWYKVLFEDGDEKEYEEYEITELLGRADEAQLTGIMSYSEKYKRHVIRGQWGVEGSTPQQFKLVHCPWPNQGQNLLPKKEGEFKESTFNGDFTYEEQKPTMKFESELVEVKESGVQLKFMKEKGLRQESYALSGKGMNRFGDFILVGKAIKRNSFDGTCEYTIQMTKKYE